MIVKRKQVKATSRQSVALIAAVATAAGVGSLIAGCAAGRQQKVDHAPAAQEQAHPATNPGATTAPAVRAAAAVEAGRYLVVVGGCNDCHTPGYGATGGKVPESFWLVGSPVGFRGPWGTTYASNLRLFAKDMSADDWVTVCKARNDKPPMPWSQLHGMSEPDLRAVHAYIKSLPPTGPATPEYVPPGKEPATPWMDFVPKNLPAGDGQ